MEDNTHLKIHFFQPNLCLLKGMIVKMKKILFGITSLTLGGAERVLVDIANNLCEKYEITIFTIYAKGELESELSSKIKRKSLFNKSYSELTKFQKYFVMPMKVLLLKKIIYHKRIKEDYAVEIAFLEGPVTRLFSIKNKETRKIAWIHNDISLVFGKGMKAKIKKHMDKKIYQKYENLIFVSKDNWKKFRQFYPQIENKQMVIYNYMDKEKVIKKAQKRMDEEFDQETINFVTVARLVEQKGLERLILIHKKLIEQHLWHNFYIIGDGPLKEKLEGIIKKEKVDNTFQLLGKKENPYPYIKNADYFCLLSYFEGYGMVLEEAKILGKQIIITDTAAREAVENDKRSIIVANNEEAIYEGLKEIIEKGKDNQIEEKENYENIQNIRKIENLLEER